MYTSIAYTAYRIRFDDREAMRIRDLAKRAGQTVAGYIETTIEKMGNSLAVDAEDFSVGDEPGILEVTIKTEPGYGMSNISREISDLWG